MHFRGNSIHKHIQTLEQINNFKSFYSTRSLRKFSPYISNYQIMYSHIHMYVCESALRLNIRQNFLYFVLLLLSSYLYVTSLKLLILFVYCSFKYEGYCWYLLSLVVLLLLLFSFGTCAIFFLTFFCTICCFCFIAILCNMLLF